MKFFNKMVDIILVVIGWAPRIILKPIIIKKFAQNQLVDEHCWKSFSLSNLVIGAKEFFFSINK